MNWYIVLAIVGIFCSSFLISYTKSALTWLYSLGGILFVFSLGTLHYELRDLMFPFWNRFFAEAGVIAVAHITMNFLVKKFFRKSSFSE